jgi:hypothetical protein
MDQQFALGSIPISGIIVGIVQTAKSAGMPDRFSPILAVVLGVIIYGGWSAVSALDPATWFTNILLGISAGLGASGLYSGTKALRE